MVSKAIAKVNEMTAEKNPKKCPELGIGDNVKVYLKIKEGDKERVQVFAGDVIARDGKGITETFTVRRISFGVGVEKVIPFACPSIDKIEIVHKSRVARAKLYYLRERSGKSARLRTI